MVLSVCADQEVGQDWPRSSGSSRSPPGVVVGIGPARLSPGGLAHVGVEADAGTGQESVDVGAAGVAPAVQFGVDRAGDDERTLLGVLPQSSRDGWGEGGLFQQVANDIGVQGGDQTRSSFPSGPMRKT